MRTRTCPTAVAAAAMTTLALLAAGSASAVTITSFTPVTNFIAEEADNCVGTQITINGSGFVNDGGKPAVGFNGMPAVDVFVGSDTILYARVPAGATDGRVTVTTPKGTATSSATYAVVPCASHAGPAVVAAAARPAPVVAPKPAIASFRPKAGTPGTKVTITGKNLTGTTSVRFRGVKARFTVTSDTSLVATVPAKTKTGRISITNAGGTVLARGPSFVVG